MWSWLSTLLGMTFPGLGDLWNAVVNLVRTVQGYIDDAISSIWNWIYGLYSDLNNFVNEVVGWVNSVYSTVIGWINQIYNDIYGFVRDVINTVYNYIDYYVNWLVNAINDVLNKLYQFVQSIEDWVIRNIWNPLASTISNIIQWIENEGAYVYNIITHPELLAQILAKYAWQASFGLLARYSAPIGRWLLRTMMSDERTIGGIIEDIIASII